MRMVRPTARRGSRVPSPGSRQRGAQRRVPLRYARAPCAPSLPSCSRWPPPRLSARKRQPRGRHPAPPRSIATSPRADPSFAWKAVREMPAGEGLTATLIDLTSQRWLTEAEVERPLWTHWLTVVRPANGHERHRVPVHQRRQPRPRPAGAGHRPGSPRWRATPAPSSRSCGWCPTSRSSSRTIRRTSRAPKTTSSPTPGITSSRPATIAGRRGCR